MSEYPTHTKYGRAFIPEGELWTLTIQWSPGYESPPLVFEGTMGQVEEYKRLWYRRMRELGHKVGTGGLLIKVRTAAKPVTWDTWLRSR